MTVSTLDAELAVRFERDAIPLRGDLLVAALRVTRSRVDAEDLVQDTLLKAYRAFATYRDGTNLRAWLLRIMTNQWINILRTRRRRPVEQLGVAITDEHRSAEVEVMEVLPDSGIAAALNKLSEDCRMAVYYADVQGMTSREIAALMGIPVGTVLSRLHRSHRRLRTLLIDADQYTSRT
jgi:RNA polymerase sigma-70 factor (ECF subfamily)